MNTLYVFPTNETKDALSTVFSGSPVAIDWDSTGVEIASSRKPIIPNEDAFYRALTGDLDVWYDSSRSRSFLVLSLIPSPEMAQRHEEVGDAFGRKLFFPFMDLLEEPVLRRNRRSFFNSISSRFVDFPIVLDFHGELVVPSIDNKLPRHIDLYEDRHMKSGQGTLRKFPL